MHCGISLFRALQETICAASDIKREEAAYARQARELLHIYTHIANARAAAAACKCSCTVNLQ